METTRKGMAGEPETMGAYVHFPWCLKKCPYCDFVSFAKRRDEIDHAGYADAVVREIELRAEALAAKPLASIFFGGGTPSLWEPRELGRVLEAIRRAARPVADLEVTVECNPTSLDEERARALADVGVSRLSVGVQGLESGRLAFLGRLHGAEGGLEALRGALRAGGLRVSADLIYGVARPEGGEALPQSPTEAAEEARRIAETGVTHVSAYSLTIEPETRFGELARRGRLPLVTDDAVAESFFAIDEALAAFGLEHYEISNYARPGHEARHNLGYWRGHDYVGLGCAAFGTVEVDGGPGALRYRNETDPTRYAERALAGKDPTLSREPLDAEARLRERIMLGLRVREGLDLEASAVRLGADPWPPERERAAERLVRAGRLERKAGRLRVPKSAWVFTDGIAADLF